MESLLNYLDIIEDILDSGKPIPFSNKISVERERIFEIISEMRMNLPNEMRQATRIIEDHDRIIGEAKQRANLLLSEAELKIKDLTSSHEIYKKATEDANELMAETRKSVRELRVTAIDYADEIISKAEVAINEAREAIIKQQKALNEQMIKTLETLHSNRQELRGNKS